MPGPNYSQIVSEYTCSARAYLAQKVNSFAKMIAMGCFNYVIPYVVCEERGHDHPFLVKLFFKPEAEATIQYIGEKTNFPLPIMVSEALQVYGAILRAVEDGTIKNSPIEVLKNIETLVRERNITRN